jgi:copper(I)-binding protein
VPGAGGTEVVALAAAFAIAMLATPAGISGAVLLLPFALTAISSPRQAASRQGPAAAAPAYLIMKNLGGADELLSARAPAARVILARRGTQPFGTGATLTGLAIPGHAATSFSPFGPDLVLVRRRAMLSGDTLPVTLTFRHAGQITVDFTVTPTGTP